MQESHSTCQQTRFTVKPDYMPNTDHKMQKIESAGTLHDVTLNTSFVYVV